MADEVTGAFEGKVVVYLAPNAKKNFEGYCDEIYAYSLTSTSVGTTRSPTLAKTTALCRTAATGGFIDINAIDD